MGRKHSKEEVLKSLRAKGCIITDAQSITKHEQVTIPPVKEGDKPKKLNKTVTVQEPFTINVSPATNLGNGSWGKIDYLCKVHDYRVVRL